jgi:hypothetical protein
LLESSVLLLESSVLLLESAVLLLDPSVLFRFIILGLMETRRIKEFELMNYCATLKIREKIPD